MSGARLPGPAEWQGSAGLPWPCTRDQDHGAFITACYGVLQAEPRPDGSWQLTLADARERVQALVEDGQSADWLRPGVYVGVRGVFNAMQELLVVHEITPVRVTLEDLPLFLPGPSRDPAQMEAELQRAIASVMEPALRVLLETMLARGSEAGQGFRLAPAATRNHHAHLGGLLEHTLSVAGICHHLAEHYGDIIDRDLLITAALLHDIGKVREIGAQAGFAYTDEGRLLGHIVLGLRMLRDGAAGIGIAEERLLLLEHLIASHQGRYEWQSPREPRTLEALLLHYADDLDAKFDPARTAVVSVGIGWSERDRVMHREWLGHQQRLDVSKTPASSAETTADRAVETASRPGAKPARPDRTARKKPKGKKTRGRDAADRSGARKKTGKNARTSRRQPSPKPFVSPGKPRAPDSSQESSPPSSIPLDPQTLDMFGSS